MTNEEAIKAIKANYPSGGYERLCEALEKAIKALEQEQKSEWEHDHEILKAHSEGAREILDIIRAEIMKLDDINPDYPMDMTVHISRYAVLQIINKYKAESEEGAEE